MSKTIRDTAQQAALSMLANEVLYAQCRYLNKDTVNSKAYYFKVTGEVLKQLIARLEENRRRMVEPVEELPSERPITIQNVLNNASTGYVEKKKEDHRIIALVESKADTAAGYSMVEVMGLVSYLSISDLETPLSSLRYLTGLVDGKHAERAQERENQVVSTIALKLQEQSSANFAINLLGNETYNSLINELNIDNSEKLK